MQPFVQKMFMLNGKSPTVVQYMKRFCCIGDGTMPERSHSARVSLQRSSTSAEPSCAMTPGCIWPSWDRCFFTGMVTTACTSTFSLSCVHHWTAQAAARKCNFSSSVVIGNQFQREGSHEGFAWCLEQFHPLVASQASTWQHKCSLNNNNNNNNNRWLHVQQVRCTHYATDWSRRCLTAAAAS